MNVIVGTDHKTEWMLPWWIENYHRSHNVFPVIFVDYGMTDEGRELCKAHGILTELGPRPHYRSMWFNKPHLLCLPNVHGKVVALDLDTEIRRNLQPLFDWIENPYELYAARDVITPVSCKHLSPFYNGGVIGAFSNSPPAHRWRRAVMEGHMHHRDDQRILSELANEIVGNFVVEIPPVYNRLRLDRNPSPDDVIRHWTGPKGKDTIRRQLEEYNADCRA